MLAELLSQFQERQIDPENPNSGLTAALELGWDALDETTQQIAITLSLFAPTPIPQAMLRRILDDVWDEDANPGNLTVACSQLAQRYWLHLIDENTYLLHAPIRTYLQAKLNQFPNSDCLKQAFCRAIVMFAKQLSDPPAIEECTAFAPAIPHITEAATTWKTWLTDEDLVFPYFCLGRFCAAQGALDQATCWYEQCLSEARDRLGNKDLAIAANLNHLANLYYGQYRYQEAEPFYQEALQILQQLLGEEHSGVTTSLSNLVNLNQKWKHSSEEKITFEDIVNFFRNPPPVYLNKELAVCYILAVLMRQDSFGTELISLLEHEHPNYRLSDTVLYSALKFLEDANTITGYWKKIEGRGRPRRMYQICPEWNQQAVELAKLWYGYVGQKQFSIGKK